MGVPSKHAERKRPQTTGLAAADPGAQPPFLWCAPRLICLAPSTSATPLRLGGQAAMQRGAQGIARGVAMSMQTAKGPANKRPSLKRPRAGAAPADGAPEAFLDLPEARLAAVFYRGRLSGGLRGLATGKIRQSGV